MNASQAYKERLIRLLDRSALKLAGVGSSDRKLQARCESMVSHTVISNWRKGNFVEQLDTRSLQALALILRHEGYEAHELGVYLKTGGWLAEPESRRLKSLWSKRDLINQQIASFAAG